MISRIYFNILIHGLSLNPCFSLYSIPFDEILLIKLFMNEEEMFLRVNMLRWFYVHSCTIIFIISWNCRVWKQITFGGWTYEKIASLEKFFIKFISHNFIKDFEPIFNTWMTFSNFPCCLQLFVHTLHWMSITRTFRQSIESDILKRNGTRVLADLDENTGSDHHVILVIKHHQRIHFVLYDHVTPCCSRNSLKINLICIAYALSSKKWKKFTRKFMSGYIEDKKKCSAKL